MSREAMKLEKIMEQAQEPTKAMIDAAERIDWSDSDVRGNIVNMWQAMLAAAPQSAQQEPMAWMDADGDLYKDEPKENWCPPHTQLYTSPQPSKPWVGLTDEEMLEVVHYSQLDNARAIEAKLKEKNT